MSLFESVVAETRYHIGIDNGAVLLAALLEVMADERTGGLPGFVEAFRRAGLGPLAECWLERRGQPPLYPSLLELVVPPRTIDRLSAETGTPRSQAVAALSLMVPRLLPALLPGSRAPRPSHLAATIGGYFARLRAARGSGPAEGAAAGR